MVFVEAGLIFEHTGLPFGLVLGSIVATAGDDGTVRLWCSNYLKVWLPLSVIRPGETTVPLPPAFLSANAAAAAVNAASATTNTVGGTSGGASSSSSVTAAAALEGDSVPTNQQYQPMYPILGVVAPSGLRGVATGSSSNIGLISVESDVSLASSAAAAAAGMLHQQLDEDGCGGGGDGWQPVVLSNRQWDSHAWNLVRCFHEPESHFDLELSAWSLDKKGAFRSLPPHYISRLLMF